MRILAWDTSTKNGSVSAWEDREDETHPIVAHWTSSLDGIERSERLLIGVDHVLSEAQWDLTQVDTFAVGVGPGSFTGLRVGVGTARTFAKVLGKSLIGVSSLQAVAWPIACALKKTEPETFIIVAREICKGELYFLTGLAQHVASGNEKGLEENAILASDAPLFLKHQMGQARRSWVVIGEAKDTYSDAWSSLPSELRVALPQESLDIPHSHSIAAIARTSLAFRAQIDPEQVMPRYLKVSAAESKLRQGLLKPAPLEG